MAWLFRCCDRTQGSRAEAAEQIGSLKRNAMKPRKKEKGTDHSGSTFDSFLEEEGIREEVEAVAIERVLAWQLEKALQPRRET